MPLFGLYDKLHKLTDGKVDPLIGAELILLGYDAQYSLQTDPRAAYYNPDKQMFDWSKTALLTDGLATVLFFVKAEKLKEQFRFSSVRVFSDMRVEVTDNFEGTLFTK